MKIANVEGSSRLLLLASQAIAALDEDEMAIAGALLGKPVDVVKCRTNSVREYYGPRANREVIEVDAVTHRAQPIFHTIVGGGYEHLILGGVPREAMLLQHLRRSFPNVLDVRLTRGGTCRYHLAIKMDKTNDGEPKNVMMSAFGAHYDIKQVVVVDKDVDISMSEEIEWAVATRFQADRDLMVVCGALGSKLDPTSNDGISAKMGLDATAPVDAPELASKRIRVKGEEQFDLAAALQADPNAAVARILAEAR